MTSVQILSVVPKQTLHGTLWRVKDVAGQHYSTLDPWIASLCDRARAQRVRVRIWSRSGWYDRRLIKVELVDEAA